MSLDKTLTTYEHRTLTCGSSLPPDAYESFKRRINDIRKRAPGALELVHDGIRTGSYCGLVTAGEWSLEILPKIDALDEQSKCRSVLLSMIGTCFDIPIWVDQPATTELGLGLLQILIRAFVQEVSKEIRNGLINRYDEIRESHPYLKGRIDVNQHIRTSFTGTTLIPSIYDELTPDNPYNRAIKWALRVALLGTQPSSRLRKDIHTLLSRLASVQEVPTSSGQIANLPLDRISQRYSRILTYASWIVDNYHPDVCSGMNSGVAFLFDMNVLFESYVARVLKAALQKCYRDDGLTVKTQYSGHQLLSPVPGSKASGLWIKPDLLIVDVNGVKLILDTKWKIFDGLAPSSSDAYQMLAYGYALGCKKLELIYPVNETTGSNSIDYRYQSRSANTLELKVRHFDLMNPMGSAMKILSSLHEPAVC